MTYRFLEHTADVGVEVEARTITQAFCEAAIALFEIMTRTSDFEPREEVAVTASGEDTASLLYDWLEQMIYLFDTSALVIVRVDLQEISEESTDLEANCWGQRFDRKVHEARTGVKAITYHNMAVKKVKGSYVLRYFVDI